MKLYDKVSKPGCEDCGVGRVMMIIDGQAKVQWADGRITYSDIDKLNVL